jgi:hypothetical protein
MASEDNKAKWNFRQWAEYDFEEMFGYQLAARANDKQPDLKEMARNEPWRLKKNVYPFSLIPDDPDEGSFLLNLREESQNVDIPGGITITKVQKYGDPDSHLLRVYFRKRKD